MKITKLALTAIVATGILTTSCSDDDSISVKKYNLDAIKSSSINAPTSYEFTRNNNTTVSFGGQTTRLKHVATIGSLLSNSQTTLATLENNFQNGEGFEDASLNGTGKKVRSKTANSVGLFSNGVSNNASAIKAVFDGYLSSQVNEVFPNWATEATAGTAGFATHDSKTRYVNAKGLEYNQAFLKGLIGGLAIDQTLNHYFNRLDDNFDGSNSYKTAHEAGTLATDKNYTTMEHHWDEAYGYVYGVDAGDDVLIQKYINRVEGDDDFKGIAETIAKAFLYGRAAIVEKNYEVRDQAIDVLRYQLSKVVGIRAVHYLQQAKNKLDTRVASFHDLSEGYGFIYSLQFTHNPKDGEPYLTQSEVASFISALEAGNGFWDVSAEKLDEISNEIASKFDFTVAQAAE